ncbi:MAG: acyl-CoA dehydrogenase family protein [Phycisphaerae bacterium]|nr:acyl-CoA dehydrogenase family protein [Phycisphaerae bacterium]
MTPTYSDDHLTLVSAVRDFARAELLERDRAWDRAEESCCTHLAPVYNMGLMGLRVPEESGGLAVPMLPYGHIIRELAWASPSVAVTVGVHNMGAEIVKTFARPAVRDALLPKLVEPGNLCTFAISEPNAGSDAAAARTRAERVAGGYRISGSKMWVTNGINGRWCMVMARLGDTGTKQDLTMFLMDLQLPQIKRVPIHGKMGIRASETAEMSLDGAFVPEENMLGEPGWGMRIGLSALDGGRIGIGSQAIGIATAALDIMSAYAKQREVFGKPIADYQAIQWMIADTSVEIAAAQQLVDRAAWLKDSGRPFTQEASMAKLYASETAGRAVDRGVQIHGGYGYVHEFRIEQLYRDARITRIYEGTSEIQRVVIARGLLKE